VLCKAVADALRITNRGAKPENSGQHTRLAFVRAGGIILELLFITNAGDLEAYDARKWLAASAVADVLAKASRKGGAA
jgi:N-acetylmuramoyl-L-alanine amidase